MSLISSLLLVAVFMASRSLGVLDCNKANFVVNNPTKYSWYASNMKSGNFGCGVDSDCNNYVSYKLNGKSVPLRCVCDAALSKEFGHRNPTNWDNKVFKLNGKCCYDSQYSKTILPPFRDNIYDIYPNPCVKSPACTVDADCKNYKFSGPNKWMDQNKATKCIRTTNDYCATGQCCALWD